MMISQMNQSQLLHWIDMVSFAVVEITEYLDTHPDDENALKYFNHYADLRRTALRTPSDCSGYFPASSGACSFAAAIFCRLISLAASLSRRR